MQDKTVDVAIGEEDVWESLGEEDEAVEGVFQD
jgi:hypothetical protein